MVDDFDVEDVACFDEFVGEVDVGLVGLGTPVGWLWTRMT